MSKRDWITPCATCMVLLIVAYAAAYFLLVYPATIIAAGGGWTALPGYYGVSPRFFEPMHTLDMTYFRPQKWAGIIPESELNETNTSGFDEFMIDKLSPSGSRREK